MNLKMNICKYSLLVSFAAASAFAAEPTTDSASVEQKQQSFLEKLEDIQKNVLGFSVNGSAKAGYMRSSVDSDMLWDDAQTAEAQAYTRANLLFSIRPSKETVAKFGIRAHKDWNNAHREGNNVPLIDWWSYDGLILNRHVDFNLGTMRVGYTPLTMYQPQADYIMEPEVFKERREEVMAERSLDGSNRRLMQGLNFTFHSYELGFLSDLYVQGTLARLRINGKKADQLFFDFDDSDRYLFGGRLGVETHGFTVGVNDAFAFDRVRSTRATLLQGNYPADYEWNNVVSGNVGYDSKKVGKSKFNFGANAEVALSYWKSSVDELGSDTLKNLAFYTDSVYMPDGSKDLRAYMFYKDSIDLSPVERNLGYLKNKMGIHGDAYAEYEASKWSVKGSANGIMNDKGFQAELAMSPVTMGLTSVLNSNAIFDPNDPTSALLQGARSGALENLYFSFYEAVPQAAYNMMINNTTGAAQVVGTEKIYVQSDTFELFNNYKYGQYYRNGYSYKTMKRAELLAMAQALDPATSIALPYGYATPNRKGGDLNLEFTWNDAITVRAVGGFYKADKLDADSLYFASGSSYLRVGGGALVKFGELFSWNRTVNLSGSYEQTKEEDYLERTSSSITAGLNVDVFGPVALLGGFHLLKNDFGVAYAGFLNGTTETLALGGPRVKLAQGAYLTLQYGWMKNAVDMTVLDEAGAAASKSVDITKNIIMADVKVNF